jgi:hypothetical protein
MRPPVSYFRCRALSRCAAKDFCGWAWALADAVLATLRASRGDGRIRPIFSPARLAGQKAAVAGRLSGGGMENH